MKIYLASPFFNSVENEVVEKAETILRNRGFEVYSPREHEIREAWEVGTPPWAERTFQDDVQAILDSDIVVMLYWGDYSDSGTAWECGYAYGMNIPVVCVHVGVMHVSNLMVHCSAITNIYLEDLEDYDFEEKPEYIYEGFMT